MAFNTTAQMLPILDHATPQRQPRFGYIPLFSLLLSNILSNTALAKYAPLGALRLSYEPIPWLQKTNQVTHDNYHYWDPINNPYGPPSPSGSSESTDQHVHHHHHSPGANQQQIVNIHERPTEILIGDTDTESTDQNEATSPPLILADESPALPMLRNSLEKPNMEEPAAAESRSIPAKLLALISNTTSTHPSNKVKRGTSKYLKVRKNNKYLIPKRKRPTTTPDYYYDSYEEEDTRTTTRRYQPKKKMSQNKRPIQDSYEVSQHKRPIVDSYEESESSISNSYSGYSDVSGDSREEDYESYELTTKPLKKRRRTTTTSTNRPKRYKNKYKNRKPLKISDLVEYDDLEYDTESILPSTTTESLKIRHQELLLRQQEQLLRQQHQLQRQQEILQRQQQAEEATTNPPTSTTSTPATTSTTPPTTTGVTTIVTGSTTGPGINNGSGNGYGPSNGHESISITYSPTGGNQGTNLGGSPVYVAPSPVYTNPSPTYGAPKPSYGPPQPSYGPPSSSYGPPSNTYGAPNSGSGFSPSVNGYYQVPFNDWYSNEVNKNSIVKKVHDIIGFDNPF